MPVPPESWENAVAPYGIRVPKPTAPANRLATAFQRFAADLSEILGYLNLPTVPPDDTGWVALTPAAGWNVDTNYPPAVRRLNGSVYLRGRFNGSINPGPVTTLPAGFRPAMLGIWIVERGGVTSLTRVTVDTNGVISQTHTNTSVPGNNMSLSPIAFPVG